MLDARRYYGSAKIDDHRIIIMGGRDADGSRLSSGFIYDVRTKQSTPLRHDMPVALCRCGVVANDAYVFVLGGEDHYDRYVNTVYRLCLETHEWTIMAPMDFTRADFAAVVKENYIYVFGGLNRRYQLSSSSQRYCINTNTWEDLPDMPEERSRGHCAVTTAGNEIYVVGELSTRSVDVFDTATLSWKTDVSLCDMPEGRYDAGAVLLRDTYLVVIGGYGGEYHIPKASSFIYDISSNLWSSTPTSMDMIDRHSGHVAAVLDGKVFVAGGWGQIRHSKRPSFEYIDIDTLLQYAPLHYPLPAKYLRRIFEIGKAECDKVRPRKKRKLDK